MSTAEQLNLLGDVMIEAVKNTRGKKVTNNNEEFELLGKTLTYPISMKYGYKDWNEVSALREFISNAKDTKTECTFVYDGKFAIISDKGNGLDEKDFVFGESSRDDSQIGQFGEGLKMGILTLLRSNRKVTIETIGFTVVATKTIALKSEVMELKFKANKRTEGTVIFAQCSNKEFMEAKNLFIDLNENISRIDNGVYLPGGDVFIIGLRTTQMSNLLFSYNILDKTMTNRDRNIVATEKLNGNIVRILNDTKNLKVAVEYLRNITTNTNAYEYQLQISPRNKEVWKKGLYKLYPDKKVALTSDIQSDLNATMMGYKVFRNIPQHVLNVLRGLGVEYSSVIAKNYKGEGLFKGNKIVYPISVDYCNSWTTSDAIREFIANGLDTGTKITVEYSNGKGRIVDTGKGIHMKHFIFGISEKSKGDIGQFGEGLKVASLVLTRNKREVEIQTIGYTYTVALENYDEFNTSLFTVYYKKNQRKTGTVITFDCSEQELNDAKNLFCHFKDARKKQIYLNELDVFFDYAGEIYVNGLKTEKFKGLFSYNVKDKSLVSSRDRNSVDNEKLSSYVVKFLNETKDDFVIDAFLTQWMSGMRDAYEYRLPVSPKNISAWESVANKLFKQACISTYDVESNFIAKQAGYMILSNIPSVVSEILIRCKVPSADKIAQKYKNKGIILNDKVVYPISCDYCSNWNVSDAIRELLANAIDTNTKVSTSVTNSYALVSDKGDGVSKKNLLFGKSTKGQDQIGQFGEGLKMASLVLARNNRDFKLVTKGFEYTAKIERDKEFNADVLVLYLTKSKKRVGTDITFKCSETELQNAKNLFLIYNNAYKTVDTNIYTPGGRVFVNGVMLGSINSLYSYNLVNAKDLIGRDRKSIQSEGARTEMKKILDNTGNKKVIETILTTNHHSSFEMGLQLNPSFLVKDIWKNVMKKVYPKHCLQCDAEYDLAAQQKGYTVLYNLCDIQRNLLRTLGMSYSTEVATLKGDEKIVKKKYDPKKLSTDGQTRWKKALAIFKKIYGAAKTKQIELVEEFNTSEVGYGTVSYYNDKNDTIYILAEVIEDAGRYAFKKILGLLIGEEVCRSYGTSKNSSYYNEYLQEETGKILEKLC